MPQATSSTTDDTTRQREDERLRELLSLSSDWFWEQDAGFRFTAVWGSVYDTGRFDARTTLGRCRWELGALGVSADQWRAHRALLDQHQPFRDFEYHFVNERGETRWLSVSGNPVFDAAGRFVGYRGVGRDITTAKNSEAQLRDSESRLRTLLELSSDWYWETDELHRLTLREGTVLTRFGIDIKRDLGKTYWALDYVNLSEADWAAHRALLERREEFRELLLGRPGPDGHLVWGRLSGRPRYDNAGKFIGYHGVGCGVTARVNAERALHESEAELRLLLENVPASIGYFDSGLYLRYFNRGFERVFGRSSADLAGRHLRDVLDAEAYLAVEPHFSGALKGIGTSYRRLNHVSGASARVLDISVVPHRDEGGRVIGCYGVAIDATEMERAGQEMRSLQHLFTSTFQNTTDLMAIYRVEADQLIIEGFNQALWRFYESRFPGVRLADWTGRSIEAFLREVPRLAADDIGRRLIPFWNAVRHARVERYQTDLPTPAGVQQRDALLVPITDAAGGVTHLFYRGADVTELVNKELELQALNAELERKVTARTADLSAANRELEAFAYAVSHDLRTPLRGIDGFSKLLAEEYSALLGDEGCDYVQRIRRGVSRMGDLIDDMLRLSQVTRGALQRRRVDLSALAHEIAAELSRQEAARRIEWHIAPGVEALADAGLMRLMLENLLGNAVKYSRGRELAVITFEPVVMPEQNGVGDTGFCVSDNGAGFDMAYAAKLFQPFQRLHGAGEFEGTGVGLATVWRIVRRHGGRIEGRGEPGKGAQFRIEWGHPGGEMA